MTKEDRSAVNAGDRVSAGEWLDVADDGALTLDFSIDTRLEVDGGSRVQLGEMRASEVIVARGAVRGLLEPVPNAARAPLHVGSPRVGLELGADGDVYLGVLPDGSARVFVLSGLAQVRTGVLDADGRPELRTVLAGMQTDGSAPVEGVSTIDAARERLVQARADAGSLAPPTTAAALVPLDAALADLAREDQARARLLAETPEQGSTAARQRVASLVQLGQHLLWRRAALLARWEGVVATSGIEQPGSPDRAAVASRTDRVKAAVGTND